MATIVNGVYYPDGQTPAESERSTTVAAIHEQGAIERIYEKHAHELIQPHHPDGTPNKDFADYYPEDAINHGIVPESEQR